LPAAEPVYGVSADGVSLESLIVKIPDGRRLHAIEGSDEALIEPLRFRVGRAATGEGKDTYFEIDLTPAAKRRLKLSRANRIHRSVFALFSNSFSCPSQAGCRWQGLDARCRNIILEAATYAKYRPNLLPYGDL
tara:strand:+ start:185 stop:586 length:402 start_codon:yes stop_codon:yes gene_type:complete